MRLLGTNEAAEIVGLHPDTIRAKVAAGELAGFKVANRLRIKESDLEAWIESGRLQPADPMAPRVRPRKPRGRFAEVVSMNQRRSA